MRKTVSIQKTFFTALILGLICNSALADRITMKNGKIHEGRIIYESDDRVRIEVAVTASIKETKLLFRKDIAEIVKDAPDNVAFAKIKKLIPTRSLMSASAYRSAIKSGPEAFLSEFPDSQHKAAVEKIKQTLSEELDKVERGNIKIKGDWYSSKDQIAFKTLIASRIHLLRMEAVAKQTNYNALIGAMREYEIIEENYFGTPAYPKALAIAQQVVPTLGRILQRMLRDVETVNAEWEKNKEQTEAVARAQIEAARARDKKNYEAGLAADKKAGIKWVRLDSRSKASIEGYLKLAAAEMPRLQVYDLAKLEAQAVALVEVDHLIADGKLKLAESKIKKAAAMDLMQANGKSSSRSNSSNKTGTKNYIPILNGKIKAGMAEEEKIKKAAEAAKKSESLTKDLKSGDAKMAKTGDDKAEGKDTEKPASNADAFAQLAQSDKKDVKDEKKGSPKKPTKKPTKKTPPKPANDANNTPPPPPQIIEEDGMSFSTIMMIVTGLLVVTIGVLKALGIGGKNDD